VTGQTGNTGKYRRRWPNRFYRAIRATPVPQALRAVQAHKRRRRCHRAYRCYRHYGINRCRWWRNRPNRCTGGTGQCWYNRRNWCRPAGSNRRTGYTRNRRCSRPNRVAGYGRHPRYTRYSRAYRCYRCNRYRQPKAARQSRANKANPGAAGPTGPLGTSGWKFNRQRRH